MRINATYLLTEVDFRRLPFSEAEVAFVGRSNVGKSSLLNAICGQKNLARVSQTPGRTRTINVFEWKPGKWLVDLPGYGFAVGPEEERRKWRGMIEGYLTGRPSLRRIYSLVDAEVGPTDLDIQLFEWLREKGIPYRIVACKVDKVKPSRHYIQRRDVAAKLGLLADDIAWVSAAKNIGIQELQREIVEQLQFKSDPAF